MDYGGFINNSADNTLTPADFKLKALTSPKTPGFKTAARRDANKT